MSQHVSDSPSAHGEKDARWSGDLRKKDQRNEREIEERKKRDMYATRQRRKQ